MNSILYIYFGVTFFWGVYLVFDLLKYRLQQRSHAKNERLRQKLLHELAKYRNGLIYKVHRDWWVNEYADDYFIITLNEIVENDRFYHFLMNVNSELFTKVQEIKDLTHNSYVPKHPSWEDHWGAEIGVFMYFCFWLTCAAIVFEI